LQYRDHIYAVIYLEKDSDCGSFSDLEREFLHQFAEMAGLSLHIALERKAFKDLSSGESPALFNQFDFGGIVGRHPNMLSLLELVGQVADSDAGVLIHGETGTGKELIARAVYRNSPRRDKPFVTIHCGALPENLFESELFGHRKGAFTGAMRDRAGRIAQAAGGTLFIDEVAEIPLAVQAKLLRFFQFGEFQRVGSDRAEQVDLRIISATHRDIPTMIKEGTFREDLYYRLKVVELKIPPLRERRSDIPLLAASFLKKYWKREGEPHLTEAAMHALGGYHFPGNVRELDHLIERVCLLTKSAEIDLGELPEEVVAGEAAAMPATLTNEWLKDARFQASRQAADEVEKRFLKTLLQHHDGNIAAAAEAAGMQKTYLYKLLNRHDLR
jgi:transcriptional regulator with GAF, ATPase, and Fis domain